MDTTIVLRHKFVNLPFKKRLHFRSVKMFVQNVLNVWQYLLTQKVTNFGVSVHISFLLVTGEDFLCAASYDSESA